jgi:hypothetical protein
MPRPRLRAAAVLTVVGLVWLLVGALGGAVGATEAPSATGVVGTTTIQGPITPVITDHLRDIIAEADRRGFQAVVVTLDTPGGLVTSMRLIVQEFLNAPLPIIVHVAPSGADAGSAGTFITLAAHVAAMAPATTIGAATPVDLQGGEVGDKIVNNAAAYRRGDRRGPGPRRRLRRRGRPRGAVDHRRRGPGDRGDRSHRGRPRRPPPPGRRDDRRGRRGREVVLATAAAPRDRSR